MMASFIAFAMQNVIRQYIDDGRNMDGVIGNRV